MLSKRIEGLIILVRCWGVPINSSSVLDGLRDRKLLDNQRETVSRVDERLRKAKGESLAEKDTYS